ncbi:hypothetical protein MMC31_002619 [Peltigera leucophlebia]|nr:hypothetical protein [Peltigera leucophlebia]
MPVRLATPMLSVDPTKMHKVDTRNVENLFGMWTVFSRCADSMEDGRRLENLSWRIWNRETLCCESQPQFTTTPAIDFSRSSPRSKDVPELSTSVDSVSSDAAFEATHTAPVEIRSNLSRDHQLTQGRSRGREKHITSLGLEKMVYAIKEKQDLKALHQSITDVVPASVMTVDVVPQPASPKLALDSSESSNSSASSKVSDSSSSSNPLSSRRSDVSVADMAGSDTSIERLSLHNVVRGFSPYQISSSYRSHSHLAPSPIPTKALTHVKIDDSKSGKTTGMFQIGGSSGDDDSSFDEQMCTRQSSLRQSSLRQSSLTAALKRPSNPRNKTSFQDELDLRAMSNKPLDDEEVFESTDDEDDEEDIGSAIEEEEDDDGSDWEDSVTDNGETQSNDQNLFKRVDSKPNLVSRRSLLTTQLNESDRKFAFAAQASKAAPPLQRSRTMILRGPSTGTSPEDEEDAALAMRGSRMTRSKPIIMNTANTHPPTLSPRTTRRNMLATELTESLRKHLLWERQQKSTTATAVLKRRHTALDVTNLQEFPGAKNGRDNKDTSKNNSWNHFFDHGLGEYHQTGW